MTPLKKSPTTADLLLKDLQQKCIDVCRAKTKVFVYLATMDPNEDDVGRIRLLAKAQACDEIAKEIQAINISTLHTEMSKIKAALKHVSEHEQERKSLETTRAKEDIIAMSTPLRLSVEERLRNLATRVDKLRARVDKEFSSEATTPSDKRFRNDLLEDSDYYVAKLEQVLDLFEKTQTKESVVSN